MWNYRVIKFKDKDTQDVSYGLYETFYNDAGDITAHAERPEVIGSSISDLKDSIDMMYEDLNKHLKDPLLTLDGDQIIFANIDCDPDDTIPFENLEAEFLDDE